MTQEERELTFNCHAGEFEAFLYSPLNKFLGIVRNEVTLLAFLCKVCESEKDGYYLVYNGERYPIRKNGKIDSDFPIHYLDDYLKVLLGF